jgi:hypothetical protein
MAPKTSEGGKQQKDKTHAAIKLTRIDSSTTSVGLNFLIGPSIARNVRNSRTFMGGCAKGWLSLTCPTDYSYLSATMGSTCIARRAGM